MSGFHIVIQQNNITMNKLNWLPSCKKGTTFINIFANRPIYPLYYKEENFYISASEKNRQMVPESQFLARATV